MQKKNRSSGLIDFFGFVVMIIVFIILAVALFPAPVTLLFN